MTWKADHRHEPWSWNKWGVPCNINHSVLWLECTEHKPDLACCFKLFQGNEGQSVHSKMKVIRISPKVHMSYRIFLSLHAYSGFCWKCPLECFFLFEVTNYLVTSFHIFRENTWKIIQNTCLWDKKKLLLFRERNLRQMPKSAIIILDQKLFCNWIWFCISKQICS